MQRQQWKVGCLEGQERKDRCEKGVEEKEGEKHEGMTGWGAHLVVCWESRHGSSPAMAFHRQIVLSVRVPVPPHLSHLYCLQKQRETMHDCPGTAGKSGMPGAWRDRPKHSGWKEDISTFISPFTLWGDARVAGQSCPSLCSTCHCCWVCIKLIWWRSGDVGTLTNSFSHRM